MSVLVKYNPGVKVWLMNKNEVTEGIICGACIDEDAIRYKISAENGAQGRTVRRFESQIGATKEDLKNMLFPPQKSKADV